MAKYCLYCGFQYPDTTDFCPNCGRPTESGFKVRPVQESELEDIRKEVKEIDDMVRQLVLTQTMQGHAKRSP